MSAEAWCAPGVYLTRVGDDVVLLDLGADRYQCLLGAAGAMSLHPNGQIVSADGDLVRDLVEAGIAVTDAPDMPRREIPPARRDLDLDRPLRRLDVVRAALALAAATPTVRRKSLIDLVGVDRTGPGLPVDEDRLADLVGAVRLARPWIPFEGACLQRAFQLRSFLSSQGFQVAWVFGVKTWPFAAHCWLQAQDLVVGDRIDRVKRFTPIMSA